MKLFGPDSNMKVSGVKLLASSQKEILAGRKLLAPCPLHWHEKLLSLLAQEIKRGVETQTYESRWSTQTDEPTTCREPARAGQAYESRKARL